ncbi:sulfatase [Tamlana fucoidanivorans]|uniref:Sulfatase n=1 Tax=Allotamlana fucoidanivorans TaxID=2583814 RepID=A0A5C4SLU1_9FLAO|nr:sulfatase [Tamlana fucoidanivorans]TNJ44969.1 sulfatase [Tamlana fucoidanivorans]
MKTKILSVSVFMALALLTGCKNQTEKAENNQNQETKKPNIVYILTDQWRGSAVGYDGNPDVKTPNLDNFAQESVNFTNAVSVTPVCTPHRAALFTGRFPTTTGMIVNDVYLPAEELTMAEIFKDAGYNTAYWGKWHLDGHGRSTYIPEERRQGFQFWKGLECSHNYTKMPYYDNNNPELKHWNKYSPFAIVEDAAKYLKAHANDEKPFLAVVSIATPHYPHNSAPKKYKAMYPKDSLTLNPNITEKYAERCREELQGYYAHATATDEAIGRLLKEIDALGLTEKTIIVFSSDHGEMMGAHGVKPFVKQLAWDESIRVPFLIKYPGIDKQKGAVVNAPINTPDILPSLLGLLNISIPETIEGEDLSELIKNPDPEVDRAALVMNVAPFGANFNDAPYRAIRTRQYTYAITPDGPSMLYDNVKDPFQMTNLLGKPEWQELQNSLDVKLKAELVKIGDEVHPREYYLKKYNYTFDEKKHAIPFWGFNEGKGKLKNVGSSKPRVQSPRPVSN